MALVPTTSSPLVSNVNFKEVPSPCFLLEEQLLRNNLEILSRVQKESGAKIICALKGYAMFSTFYLVRRYLPGVTASSLNEAKLGYYEFGGEVHAYSPAYIDSEMEELLDYCGHISFNSIGQWERFKWRIERRGEGRVSAGLRINPEYSEGSTALYDPCIKGSRLGVTADQIGKKLPAGIEGLHAHTHFEADAEVLERTVKAIEEKFGHLLKEAKWLNLGGGHAITRKGYNIDLLIEIIKKLKEKYDLEVILEPGTAVGWETGYLVSSVLDIVDNQGTKTAMLDVSFSAHMPDCIEMPYRPKVLSESPTGKHVYNLGGMTCLAGDFMPDYHFEAPLKIGDKIVFHDMIHYTMVKTTTFNGVNLPNIGIWTEEGRFRLVRRFGYDEYRSRLS